MKILWIPHGTWMRNVRQRDQYFIEKLKDSHEIHVLNWSEPKGHRIRSFINPFIHLAALREWSKVSDNITLHHFRRLCLSRFALIRKINEYFFQKKIKKIIKAYEIDIIICGPNHYLNGFPPFDCGVPIVFDYVDYESKDFIKKRYFKKSAAILCVSKTLLNEALQFNKNSYYLPNGVDIEKFKLSNPVGVRKKYNLFGKKVVSLIGITCSEQFYFLYALPEIKKKVPNVKFLIVGDSPMLPEMKKYAEKYGDDIIFTGWVDYSEIQDYFAATDVGIYPVEKNIYFDSASPIKIFEYTAAKKSVVTVPLQELEFLNFSNVIFAESNYEDFSKRIIEAFNSDYDYPKLDQFDWNVLSNDLDQLLKMIIKQ